MQTSFCRRFLGFAIGPLLLLSLAAVSFAQIDTASIIGTIKDSTGAVIGNAKVTVTNVATNETQTVTTGPDGSYVFPYLRVGSYTVGVELTGFKKTVSSQIALNVQDRKQVDLQLQVGSATQSIEVTVEAPLLD